MRGGQFHALLGVAVSVRAERVLAVTDVDLYADDLAQIRQRHVVQLYP
jgi:hypothetical protein